MACASMPLGFHVESHQVWLEIVGKHQVIQPTRVTAWAGVWGAVPPVQCTAPPVQYHFTGMPQCGDCSLCSATLLPGLGEKPILRHLQLSWHSSAIVGRNCLQKPGRTLTWNPTITPDTQKTLSTGGQEPHRKLPVSSKSRSLGIPDPEIVGLPVPSLSTGGWECSSGPMPSAFLHVSALNLFIC